MCHSRWALSCFGIQPRSKSLCRLYAVPAAHGSFPTLSLRIFPWMLDPLPRRYTVCSHLFLPRCHRPSPREKWVGFPRLSLRIPTSRRRVHEAADIPLCSGLQVCSPPRSFLPLRILPQGSRGFYVRAYRAPPHAPDMLTVRIQVIDGTGTFTLSDSQPCRLLLSLTPKVFGATLFFQGCATMEPISLPQKAAPPATGHTLTVSSTTPCSSPARMEPGPPARGRYGRCYCARVA